MSSVKQVWLTSDNKTWDKEHLAIAHEAELKSKLQTKFSDFLNGWSGRDLLKSSRLTDTGNWVIYGEVEDPGPFGGPPQVIGHLEGKLEDVIRAAIQMPGFYTWGGGGSIKPFKIESVPTFKKV